jgi:transposase
LHGTPFHFVGSLVPSQHSELLAIPGEQFRPLTQAGLEDVKVYRTQKKVFGQMRTIVVTFNQNLYDGQRQGLTARLDKARQKLGDMQTLLQRRREGKVKRGKRPTLDSVKKQIHAICSAQFVEKILKTEVQSVAKGLELTFRTDQVALEQLCRVQFGKTLLFTDNIGWTDDQIVSAYCSQYHIEDAFKQMKDPHFLGWSPMFHWTDTKIQVHAFYCVLALLLTSLLQRDLAQKGERLSINRL